MSVVASLVLGSDGSTTPSQLISNDIDRRDFLQRRRRADCILTGGNTARTESYSTTPAPLVVITRQIELPCSANPEEDRVALSLEAAIEYAQRKYGDSVSLEVGPYLLLKALESGLVNELHLTITDKKGAQEIFRPEDFLRNLNIVEDKIESGTRLIIAMQPR